jgi:septum formation inhibitor-activating ATPase MinD
VTQSPAIKRIVFRGYGYDIIQIKVDLILIEPPLGILPIFKIALWVAWAAVIVDTARVSALDET